MDVTTLRRNLGGYSAQAKLAGAEFDKAVRARKLDATSKSGIKNAILGELNTDISESAVRVEKLKRKPMSESEATVILQVNEGINGDATYLNEVLDWNLELLESMMNSTQTIELNRAILLPTIYTTYMSSSGKDKVPYRVTKTQEFKRKTKVINYKIGDKTYNSAELFRDQLLMKKAADGARNAKLVKINLASVDSGVLEFGANKVVTVAPNAALTTIGTGAAAKQYQGYTVTETAEVVTGMTLGSHASVKYLEFTNGTDKILVKPALDETGKSIELGAYNKTINIKGIANPYDGKKGAFIAQYDAENKELYCAKPDWGFVGFVFEVVPTIWQDGSSIDGAMVEPSVEVDTINKSIDAKCMQKFDYNPETKILWEDLAELDIINETLLAFQNYKINHKDSAVYRDIHATVDILREIYSLSTVGNGTTYKNGFTIDGAITNGFISTSLDFKAAQNTTYLDKRQEAKFERLVEQMGYASLFFRKFTHANAMTTNWGMNSSTAIFVSQQNATLSAEGSVGGVRPLNSTYYFAHGGIPMKVVISEREPEYRLTDGDEVGVPVNGYPIFGDENMESKALYQWFIFQQFEAPDYRLTSNPMQKSMIDIDNYGMVTFGKIAAEINVKNLAAY